MEKAEIVYTYPSWIHEEGSIKAIASTVDIWGTGIPRVNGKYKYLLDEPIELKPGPHLFAFTNDGRVGVYKVLKMTGTWVGISFFGDVLESELIAVRNLIRE